MTLKFFMRNNSTGTTSKNNRTFPRRGRTKRHRTRRILWVNFKFDDRVRQEVGIIRDTIVWATNIMRLCTANDWNRFCIIAFYSSDKRIVRGEKKPIRLDHRGCRLRASCGVGGTLSYGPVYAGYFLIRIKKWNLNVVPRQDRPYYEYWLIYSGRQYRG